MNGMPKSKAAKIFAQFSRYHVSCGRGADAIFIAVVLACGAGQARR